MFLFPRERMIDACCICFCFCFSPLWIVEDHEEKKCSYWIGPVMFACVTVSLIMNLTLQFPKPFHESDFFFYKKMFFDLTTFLCFI